MKRVFKLLGLTLITLTIGTCQTDAHEAYVNRCVKAANMATKAFGSINKADKFYANGKCTCRSRGLQSLLTTDEFADLQRATKAEKTVKFRIAEQNYLTNLISKFPERGEEFGEMRSVCRRYAVEAKSNFRSYQNNELPELPY